MNDYMNQLQDYFADIKDVFERFSEDRNEQESIWKDRWFHFKSELENHINELKQELQESNKHQLTHGSIEIEGSFRACIILLDVMNGIEQDEVI
jgi:hypothetical protein